MTSVRHASAKCHDSFSHFQMEMLYYCESLARIAHTAHVKNISQTMRNLICAQNVDADVRCACVPLFEHRSIATYVRWPKFIYFFEWSDCRVDCLAWRKCRCVRATTTKQHKKVNKTENRLHFVLFAFVYLAAIAILCPTVQRNGGKILNYLYCCFPSERRTKQK